MLLASHCMPKDIDDPLNLARHVSNCYFNMMTGWAKRVSAEVFWSLLQLWLCPVTALDNGVGRTPAMG